MIDRTGDLLKKGSLRSVKALMHRLGQCWMNSENDYRWMQWKSSSSRTPRSSSRTRSQNSTRRIIATTKGFSWSSWTRSYKDEGIAKIPKFYLRWVCPEEVHRGSEDYCGIIWKTSRTTEWSKLHEWFQGFSGCWVDSQWKFTLPVNQEYSLNILLFKGCWGLPSYRSDTLRSRQIWGYIRYITKRLCTSTNFFVSSVSSRIEFYLEENYWRTNSHIYSGEKWKTRTIPRSEMPIWTVSQRFSHLQWRRLFRELWGRPTTTAVFGSSFWQVPYASNLCLLEDKIQDWGLYLFTISYGSDAMDQGSGVGWLSGWIEIFVIYSWYFDAEFWCTWCEDCFSPEQNHPKFPFQKGKTLWRNKKTRKRTVSEVDRLPTWSRNNSRSLEPMILSKTTPTCSPFLFEMTIFRNSILSGTEYYCLWQKSRMMTSRRIVQIKNTQDRIGICTTWRLIKRS